MGQMKGNAEQAEVEANLKRNPHPDFKKVEASREPYSSSSWTYTKTPKPDWTPGEGPNQLLSTSTKKFVSIDPYEEGRPSSYNYKLLISGITPRPIGFVSSISASGVPNLAPFSYTQVVNHDPPIFVIGFAGSMDQPKDSLRNILEAKEFVINMISEGFVEAANFTSINAPNGVSEWDCVGLTPVKCSTVKPARVGESVFSIECVLRETKEWRNKEGKVTGVTVFGEGVMFHVREDAINEEKNLIDPAVLKSVGRLGGISYCTVDKAFEIPRPDFDAEMKGKLGKIIDSEL